MPSAIAEASPRGFGPSRLRTASASAIARSIAAASRSSPWVIVSRVRRSSRVGVADDGRHRVTGQQRGIDGEPAGRPGAAEDRDHHGRVARSAGCGAAVEAAGGVGASRWQSSFHVSMTGRSRSQPRIETVAVDEREEAARGRRQAEPAGAEDAKQVAVAEEQGVAGDVGRQAARDDPVGAGPDLVDGLAARPRPGPDRPVGVLVADVGGQPALERAVVPLHQVRVGFRLRAEAGEAGRVGGAGEGTGQDEAERMAVEPAAERLGLRRARSSVSGMSVRPVWRPRRAHSVSPWRTSQTCRSTGAAGSVMPMDPRRDRRRAGRPCPARRRAGWSRPGPA